MAPQEGAIMLSWIIAWAFVQDPQPPKEPEVKPAVKIAPAQPAPMPPPVPPQPAGAAVQDGVCDGKCHEGQVCPQLARICTECRQNVSACGVHSRICQACADKKQVCPFCRKPTAGSRADAASKVQAALGKALPGHKLGRELPGEHLKALPQVKFFMVMHGDVPCKTCAAHSEPLGVIEYKGEKDSEGETRLISSEKELSELLLRHKLGGKEKAALCAAMLVQALWEPLRGNLKGMDAGKPVEPEQAKLAPEGEGFKASFEFKRGRAFWLLHVTLDKDGAFAGLSVEDTGRVSKD
jgi:hypothetical protein